MRRYGVCFTFHHHDPSQAPISSTTAPLIGEVEAGPVLNTKEMPDDEAGEVVEEAEREYREDDDDLELSTTASGYKAPHFFPFLPSRSSSCKGVYLNNTRYQAYHDRAYIGSYDTAVDAARFRHAYIQSKKAEAFTRSSAGRKKQHQTIEMCVNQPRYPSTPDPALIGRCRDVKGHTDPDWSNQREESEDPVEVSPQAVLPQQGISIVQRSAVQCPTCAREFKSEVSLRLKPKPTAPIPTIYTSFEPYSCWHSSFQTEPDHPTPTCTLTLSKIEATSAKGPQTLCAFLARSAPACSSSLYHRQQRLLPLGGLQKDESAVCRQTQAYPEERRPGGRAFL